MRKALTAIVLIIIILGAGYYIWPEVKEKISKPERPSPIEEAQDLEKAQSYLDASEPEKALEIIRKYDAYITPLNASGQQWLDLLITSSEQIPNVRQIRVLYEFFPESFDNRENSALLIAQTYLNENRSEDFKTLRDKWKGRETKLREWFLLDADKMLLDGDKQKAVALLKSQKFKQQDDIPRLIRLSMLTVEENPRESWGYLKDAKQKDPENPQIRIYRGRLLESAGKDALALSEYIAASQLKPENPALRDQLAEFFLRYQQYPQALEIWDQAIKEGVASDPTILKAWFWSRVTTPSRIDWSAVKPKEGPLKPYLEYVLGLSKSEFWDASSFDTLANKNRYLQTQQSTFWLRLLQLLNEGKEAQALQLIKSNPFKERSWQPDLETALERVLTYRKEGTLSISVPVIPNAGGYEEEPSTRQSPFFQKLEELAGQQELAISPINIPQPIETLLKSDDAIAVTLLAGGWYEAALDLKQMVALPNTFPEWVGYAMTQAIRQNRGDEAALQFALKQPSKPDLQILTAELLAAAEKSDKALETLTPLLQEDSPTGEKARVISSILYINQKKYDKAKKLISANPEFHESLAGQELLARIALLEGNVKLAETIYSNILDQSAEAKSYYARKAYSEKNWPRARKFTEQLLAEYPNNLKLRQNLHKIVDEQNKSKR